MQSLEQEIQRVTTAEIKKQLKLLLPSIKNAVTAYIGTKGFKKALKKAVQEDIDEYVFDDNIFSRLPEKFVDRLLLIATRSILK